MKVESPEIYYKTLGDWQKVIGFHIDEINSFEKRLRMVTGANNKKAILEKVEHYQNQFIVQKEQLQILLHDITEEKKHVRVTIAGKDSKLSNHPAKEPLESRMTTAVKIFGEIKSGYNRFLSEVL